MSLYSGSSSEAIKNLCCEGEIEKAFNILCCHQNKPKAFDMFIESFVGGAIISNTFPQMCKFINECDPTAQQQNSLWHQFIMFHMQTIMIWQVQVKL